jgi:hypothetical protein
MEIGEIAIGAGGPVERLHVGYELDQVSRREARRDAEVAQDLHEQPSRVAARAAARLERLLGRLHPRLHAHQIFHLLLQDLVEAHQEQHRVLARLDRLAEVVEPRRELGPERRRLEERDELLGQRRRVFERELLGVLLDEEVEGIDDREVGDQVDLDRERVSGLGEYEPRHPVAVRVLLPVEEMLVRRDLERVAEHRRAGLRRRPQTDLVRTDVDEPVELVRGAVRQCDAVWPCAITSVARRGSAPRTTRGGISGTGRRRGAAPGRPRSFPRPQPTQRPYDTLLRRGDGAWHWRYVQSGSGSCAKTRRRPSPHCVCTIWK